MSRELNASADGGRGSGRGYGPHRNESSSEDDGDFDDGGQAKVTPAVSTPLEPEQVGMTCGQKLLYASKEDRHGRWQWQTEIPADVGKVAEDAESDKWALIVRYQKTYQDPKKVLAIHSIKVQSPLIRDTLNEILAGYPGVAVKLKRLSLGGRFEPLIHRWPALREHIAELKKKRDDGNADLKINERIQHATLLNDVLTKEFHDVHESMNDMQEQGVITYEHLWTIFQPSSLVYSERDNQDHALRLRNSKYGVDRNQVPCFWLTCFYVDFDGTRFGTQKLNISIAQFEGTQPINTLDAYPLQFHKQADEIKSKLIERGSTVESLAGTHYRSYNGVGWRPNQYGGKDKTSVSGRVVIDAFGYNRFNPDHAIYVTPLNIPDPSAPSNANRLTPLNNSGEPWYDSSAPIGSPGPGYLTEANNGGMSEDGHFNDDNGDGASRPPLTEDEKLTCSPMVRGYAMKEKMWLNFFINAVHDIKFNDRAFDALSLPNNQKELILGFTSTKQACRRQFDDVIEGKGRGIIILLSGPPGVGKTLTAESVSEQMNVPLYTMAAGDLGLNPSTVETKLQGVLDMCSRWGAILLLDEADVFLEQRSMHDLERNKLVSIFLRILEYYEGIMFLTTNRVSAFDIAFQSRIHISLEYSELDKKSRKSIWETFLKQHDVVQAAARAKKPVGPAPQAEEEEKKKAAAVAALHETLTQPHALSKQDVDRLADIKLNGRQIKNFLKTGQLLANHREEPLAYRHIETAVSSMQHLHKVSVASDEARAGIFN